MKKLVLVALAAAAGLANAEVLVYEGFGPNDYAISASGQGTASSYPSINPLKEAIGVWASNKKWAGMGGSQIKVYGSNWGLSLPQAMINAGFTACGGSIGLNNGANDVNHRAMNHMLTTDVLKRSEGKLYLRMLVCIDSKAAGQLAASAKMSNKGGGYYGFGVMMPPTNNDYYMLSQSTSPSSIGFAIWKNNSSQYVLSLALTDASGMSSNYPVITGIAMDTTYVCYAEIDIGADDDSKELISAGAMSNADYSKTLNWQQKNISIQLMTDTKYPTCMAVTGPYGSNGGFFRADEIRIGTEITDVLAANTDGPALGDFELSQRKSDGSYDVTIAVAAKSGIVKAIAQKSDEDPAPIVVASAAEVAAPNSETLNISGFAADTTYQILAAVENASGAETNKVGTIYNGTLSLTKVKDASEYQREAGEVTVSRAAADPYKLTVNYSLSSESPQAAEGQTWEAPSSVTIPAGATSATLTLKPKIDPAVTEDIIVTLMLDDGNYAKPSPASVDLTLYNLSAPEGYNTWVAAESGKASVASNWSKGVPTSSDNILFDGNFSTANCEWDGAVNGLTTSVASWTQRNGYSGVVMVDTVYSGDFACLTVNGDMDIGVGCVSQHTNTTANTDTYRLRLDVKGDLTVASGAKINVSACGPNNGVANKSIAYAADMDGIGTTWGDPKLPTACGKAGNNKSNAGAGGAAYITVTGTTTLNGSLLAEGVQTISPYAGGYNGWGCGGSIYLETGSFAGSGIVSVNVPLYVGGDNSRGTPGRISIWSKTTASTFPVDNLRAWGNRYQTDYNIGAGTVVVRNPGEANGTLYIRNYPDRNFSYNITVPQQGQTTSIPKGATWTFDAVVLGNFGMLTIPNTATLILPNGFASVSCMNSGGASSNGKNWHCGIVLRNGGSVQASLVNNKHEIKGGRWTFCPNTLYTFNGNLEISGGANLGVPLISQGTNNFLTCNAKIDGDLDVKSDGLVSAEYGGLGGASNFPKQGYVAFPDGDGNMSSGTGHGGQKATAKGNNSYDSFFAPHLPGAAGGHGDVRNMGAGVINLEVTGTLNVDGKISGSAVSFSADNHAGGTGALNIKAGVLTGGGRIIANTTPTFSEYAKSGYGSSGGGRVAVRLTGANSVFSDYWCANVTAKGYSKTGTLSSKIVLTSENQRYSSAGSVYLQTAAEGEKRGTIIIRNDGVAANTAYTSLPAAKYTDEIADFKKAKLKLVDCGKVRLYDTLKMDSLSMAENSVLDLNGKTLTVHAAWMGAGRLTEGSYSAADVEQKFAGYVVDSAGTDGRIVVYPGGLQLIIR